MIILNDIEAFGPGYHFNFPEVAQQESYRDWYNQQYGTLLPAPTIDNGLKLFDSTDIIRASIFKMTSDFYASAVLSEPPAHSSESEEAIAWLMQNSASLDRALRRGTFYWSIHDLGVWTAEPGFIRAIDPNAYFRVGERDQPDALVGHIIAYRYREPESEDERLNAGIINIPNRIKVIKVSGGRIYGSGTYV